MSVGSIIKENRNMLNFTQKELADQLHVSRQTISNWEVERSYPDIESLILLSDIFNLSLDKLLKEDVHMISSLKKRSIVTYLYFSIMIALVIGSAISIIVNLATTHQLSWSLMVCASCLLSGTFLTVFKMTTSYCLFKSSLVSIVPFGLLLFAISQNVPELNVRLLILLASLWVAIFLLYIYLIEFTSLTFWQIVATVIIIGLLGNILTNWLLDRNLITLDFLISFFTNTFSVLIILLVDKYNLDKGKVYGLLTSYQSYTQTKKRS